MEKIRNWSAEEKWKEANDLANQVHGWQNGGEGNKHPGFKMAISLPQEGAISAYSRECDFSTGEITVKWTDVCNTVPAILMEMLVNSKNDAIELLPAIPQSLQKGSVSGIKTRNRTTIEHLEWDLEQQKIVCRIKSDVNQNILLIQRNGILSISGNVTIREETKNLALHQPVEVSSVAWDKYPNRTDGHRKNPGNRIVSQSGQNTLYVEGLQEFDAYIFDLQGKEIARFIQANNYLDISSVKAGNYILQCKSGNRFYTGKFIKE